MIMFCECLQCSCVRSFSVALKMCERTVCWRRGEELRASVWLEGVWAALCGQHERSGPEGQRAARHSLCVDTAPGKIPPSPENTRSCDTLLHSAVPSGHECLLRHHHWVLGSWPWGQANGSLCGGALQRSAAWGGGTQPRSKQRGRRGQRKGLRDTVQSKHSLPVHARIFTLVLLFWLPENSSRPTERWYRGIPWFHSSQCVCGVSGLWSPSFLA